MREILRSAQDDIGLAPAVFEKIDRNSGPQDYPGIASFTGPLILATQASRYFFGSASRNALFVTVFISGDPGSTGAKFSAPSRIWMAHRPHSPTLHSQPSG